MGGKKVWIGLHPETEEAKVAGECVTLLAGLRYRTGALRVAKYLVQIYDTTDNTEGEEDVRIIP